jgi:hypothetical protein
VQSVSAELATNCDILSGVNSLCGLVTEEADVLLFEWARFNLAEVAVLLVTPTSIGVVVEERGSDPTLYRQCPNQRCLLSDLFNRP